MPILLWLSIGWAGTHYQSISAADLGPACGVYQDGSVRCWSPGAPRFEGTWQGVAVGDDAACVWGSSGAQCTGWIGEFVPSEARQIAISGHKQVCVLAPDGSVSCQTKSSFTSKAASPPPEGRFEQISVDGGGGCGLDAHRMLTCWGAEGAPTGAFRTVSGGTRGCGIRTDGSLACWGSEYITRGMPTTGTWKQVDTYYNNACAVSSAGTVACWGAGDVDRTKGHPESTFVDVDLTHSDVYGLTQEGRVLCWGSSPKATIRYDDAAPSATGFAKTPTKRFVRADAPELRKRIHGETWEPTSHPPLRGPFGPNDDDVVGFDNGLLVLLVPIGEGEWQRFDLGLDIDDALAVYFDNVDDDPALEAVVVGGVYMKMQSEVDGEVMHYTGLAAGFNAIADWTGTELRRITPDPDEISGFRATTAAELKAALEPHLPL